jgi:1,3-beta-glucan synthase
LIDHVQNLLYHQVTVDNEGGWCALHAPAFFILQADCSFKGKFFPSGIEAAQCISFFAQSLTMAFLEALPVDAMPSFTVLMLHYSEKVGLMCW